MPAAVHVMSRGDTPERRPMVIFVPTEEMLKAVAKKAIEKMRRYAPRCRIRTFDPLIALSRIRQKSNAQIYADIYLEVEGNGMPRTSAGAGSDIGARLKLHLIEELKEQAETSLKTGKLPG